jgi:hypothetical protein
MIAAIDWQAVGAVAAAIAAIVAIAGAVAASLSARQAKREAGAAEESAKQAKRQAEAAEKMAKLAEAEQTRATEPSLRIRRWPGGFAQVQINESEQTVRVYIENLRPVVAALEAAYLNDQLGRFDAARCDPESPAIIRFPTEAIGYPGDDAARPHQLRVSVQVPESGRTGRFTATLLLQEGGWNAYDEELELSR